MASEESSIESSSKTRSKTQSERSGEISEDNPTSETESVFVESSNNQRPKKYRSDVLNYFTKNAAERKVL